MGCSKVRTQKWSLLRSFLPVQFCTVLLLSRSTAARSHHKPWRQTYCPYDNCEALSLQEEHAQAHIHRVGEERETYTEVAETLETDWLAKSFIHLTWPENNCELLLTPIIRIGALKCRFSIGINIKWEIMRVECNKTGRSWSGHVVKREKLVFKSSNLIDLRLQVD